MKSSTMRLGITIVACMTATVAGAQPADAPEPLQITERGCVVTFLEFSSDGKTLAYGLWPGPASQAAGAAVVVDRATRKVILRIDGRVSNGALSPDGKTLALRFDGSTLSVWDVAVGKKLRDCDGSKPGNAPIQLAFLSDGKTLAESVWNARNEGISLWDTATGKLIRRIGDSRGYAEHFAVSADGKTIRAFHEARRLVKYNPGVHFGIRPQGDMVAEVENALCLWDTATGKELWAVTRFFQLTRNRGNWGDCSAAFGSLEHGFRVRVSPDGQLFFTPGPHHLPLRITANDGQDVVLWDLADKKIRTLTHLGKRRLESVVLSSTGYGLGLIEAYGVSSEATLAMVYDLRDLADAERAAAAKLATKELDALWADLAGADYRKAHAAMFRLAQMPAADFGKFMQERVPTIAPPDVKRIERLIRDLNSSTFSVRNRASRELEKGAQEVAGALRVALNAKPPLEEKRRMEQILDIVNTRPLADDTRRGLRVIDLLQQRPSEQSQTLLEILSRAAPGSWVSMEAKAASGR